MESHEVGERAAELAYKENVYAKGYPGYLARVFHAECSRARATNGLGLFLNPGAEATYVYRTER